MTTLLKRLKQGDWNYKSLEHQLDGSVIITLLRHNEVKPVKFRVKNLNKPNEQEVDIGTGKPIAK